MVPHGSLDGDGPDRLGQLATQTGGIYDPVIDSWTPTSTGVGTPAARWGHTAVWTGSVMIVWGGAGAGSNTLDDGAAYDPAANTWTTIAAPPATLWGRIDHSAIWTGSEMIVWGGEGAGGQFASGARYSPSSDSWRSTTFSGVPEQRSLHGAVWTGTEMIVWGGNHNGALRTGGRYDPVSDSWRPTTSVGAPSARFQAPTSWTGSEMIVWGGQGGGSTGGRYDPVQDLWVPTTTVGAPVLGPGHAGVWTGSRLVVWGGMVPANGASYDPMTDSWQPLPLDPATPSPRGSHTAVWTGAEMLVWGGMDGAGALDTGGIYVPILDAWVCRTGAIAALVVGPGPGWNYTHVLEAYRVDGSDAGLGLNALPGMLGHGVRPATANVVAPAGSPDEILAAPGPGPTHPPRIRGFDASGPPLSGLDFLAYGTGGFGANVSGGPIDAAEEIVTGPGPAPVFGPQVRGFRYAAGTVTPIAKVSFFSYGTLRYGVNVATASVDADAFAEILTGAGPGSVFGPHVRGFDFDGVAVTPIGGVSFFAYGTPRYGVRVAGGDVDLDGFEEIVTGPGPSSVFGAHLRGFDVDGGAATAVPAINAFVFSGATYGVMPAAGDLDLDGRAEIAAGAGPDPAFASRTAAFRFDGSGLTTIAPLSLDPFGLAYGTTVAIGALDL